MLTFEYFKTIINLIFSEHETSASSSSKKVKETGPNGGTYSSSAYNYPVYSNSSGGGYPPPSQWSGNYNYDYNQWSSYNQSSYGYGNSY